MDLPIRIKTFDGAQERHAIPFKFGEILFTSITKLKLQAKASVL